MDEREFVFDIRKLRKKLNDNNFETFFIFYSYLV